MVVRQTKIAPEGAATLSPCSRQLVCGCRRSTRLVQLSSVSFGVSKLRAPSSELRAPGSELLLPLSTFPSRFYLTQAGQAGGYTLTTQFQIDHARECRTDTHSIRCSLAHRNVPRPHALASFAGTDYPRVSLATMHDRPHSRRAEGARREGWWGGTNQKKARVFAAVLFRIELRATYL